MQKPLISSPSNPLIKKARALRQKKARTESGLFRVEGIHHVGEAVESGWEVQEILYDMRTPEDGRQRGLILWIGVHVDQMSK